MAVVLTSGLFITSCDDYLTIIPPSVVVHEDFWHTEAEVNGMIATAYITLCNSDAISKQIIWGETRAETVDYTVGRDNESIKYLLEGLLYDDNGYAPWDVYYKAIGVCNLVLEYGPEVTTNDPNFTVGEMTVAEGEMRALRAYAHFMLLRSFCNIPMATQVVMGDDDIPEYPQVHPMEALNAIYEDLEIASTKVLKSSLPSQSNLGKITTNAVYAMMADVNMWRAAFAKYYETAGTDVAMLSADEYYDMATQNCDVVLNRMEEIHQEQFKDVDNEELNTPFKLIPNDGDEELRKYSYSAAYDAIFGTQNSRESIFEFQITDQNHAKNGSGISAIYGTEGEMNAELIVASNFIKKFKDDDLRKYVFTTYPDADWKTDGSDKATNYAVIKYAAKTSPTSDTGDREYRTGDDFDANWIVYRKSDVLLMKAEALVSRTVADSLDIANAFFMANAINKRWKTGVGTVVDTLLYDSEMEAKECLDIVREERALELCFEGKRWFDIVRMALQGENPSFSYQGKRHNQPDDEMQKRYSHISAYFMPISKEEIRFNKLLKQNESCKSVENDDPITQK